MTHRNSVRLSKLSLALVAALAAAPVFAQSTSAGVGGVVTGADGQPVAGAEVTITHVDSGTISRVTTDANGRYTARGLRVGGPYSITVVKTGAGADTESGIYLDLNKINTVNAALHADVTTLDAVTAVGVSGGSSVFSATKMGSGTSVDQHTIEALPSVNGNIQDYMRLDPRVAFIDRASGSMSAGGQNPRFNSISIDGVSASDTFGLEGNNMPTRRQPVSLEAIEAIDVNLSNYDVTIAGAAGANVNAVTKSGTNEFHGSVYGTYRDGDWFGKNPFGDKFNGFTKESTYGATFGGPLVKDKLFFFANYEKFEQKAPGFDLSTTPLGKGSITQADVTRAQQIAQGYGIDAGSLESNGDTNLEEYALKLDWNINDAHRASFRYSKLDQSKLRINGIGSTTVSLSSYWYQHAKTVESYVGQVFSDWTENFSTEFKASYRDYSAVREIPTNAPSIAVYFGGNENAPAGDILYLGTEANSQNNILSTKTWDFYGAGTLTMGDHDLKFGAQWSDNDIYNYFGRNSFGVYQFFGLDNFAAGKWSRYDWNAETSPNSIAAAYHNRNLGLFLQDTWYVNSNLTLTLGLRADKPSVDKNPPHVAGVENVVWATTGETGFDNSQVFSGKTLFQPRFGFNYTFDSDRQMQLRGGVGLFQGDAPQVWLSNSYANAAYFNYVAYTQQLRNACDQHSTAHTGTGSCAGVVLPALPFSPDGSNQNQPTGAGSTVYDLSLTGKDFDLPSIWKANLAFETETGWMGTVFSTEILMTDTKTGLYYKALNLGPGFTGPDGRTLYYNPNVSLFSSGTQRFGRNPTYNNVYLIDNTGKGKSQQLTVSLTKPWSTDSDWSWSLGYTYTNATEVGSLTSSTASSGYTYQYSFNTGENLSRTARYEIKDRFSGSLDWNHKFFGDYTTHVGLVYEGRSGRPYSFVYTNDANGDTRTANDLFYVPAGKGDVLFGTIVGGKYVADAAMESSFFEWLDTKAMLSQYAGTYAPANAFRASWVNTFDLRLSQELPGLFMGHKSQLWVDVQNVGNLLNKKWGDVMDYGFFADSRAATLVGIDPVTHKYVYSYRDSSFNNDGSFRTKGSRWGDSVTVANGDADGFDQGISQWSVQVGFKYEF
jgi:hypothetical protein